MKTRGECAKEARDWSWIIVGQVLLEWQVQNAECSEIRCFNRIDNSIGFPYSDTFQIPNISITFTFWITVVAHMTRQLGNALSWNQLLLVVLPKRSGEPHQRLE